MALDPCAATSKTAQVSQECRMSQTTAHRLDIEDGVFLLPIETPDPVEQMASADRADWLLLRLVLCAASATLVLALASSLGR
jgi:hypothetical protein